MEWLLTRVEKTQSFHVSGRRRQAGRCVAARTHMALYARWPRRTRARDPPRITVASPIHSFLFFANYFQNLNWSQNSAKTKVVQNFEWILSGRAWIWVEGHEFEENSFNSKFQFGENSNLNWGKLEIPKLLLIFLNNLKNSQNKSCSIWSALQLSCWSLFKIPHRFWIRDSNWKRGQCLEICIFKITLNFV